MFLHPFPAHVSSPKHSVPEQSSNSLIPHISIYFSVFSTPTNHQFWGHNTHPNLAVPICRRVSIFIMNLQLSCPIHDSPFSKIRRFRRRSIPFYKLTYNLITNTNISSLKYTPPLKQWLRPYFYQPFTLGPVTWHTNHLVSLLYNPVLLRWGLGTLLLGWWKVLK